MMFPDSIASLMLCLSEHTCIHILAELTTFGELRHLTLLSTALSLAKNKIIADVMIIGINSTVG